MAVRFLAGEVSDLCLGKPALRSLPVSATVADALAALKRSGESYLSVWSCEHSVTPPTRTNGHIDCRCVGKICMIDVICFLCVEKNLKDPSSALQAPLSDLLPKVAGLVRHLEPQASLLDAIDCILEGAQNLVVPIESHFRTTARKKHQSGATFHNGREFCWLTQEDVIRFLLNSISVFSPLPAFAIKSLNLVDTNFTTIYYDHPAFSALDSISLALIEQKPIGVVDEHNKLIGEISPYTVASCDETVAAAITTLSVGDLMAYVDYGGPPEDLVELVKMRMEEKSLGGMMELIEEISSSNDSSGSSDEEFGLRSGGGSGRCWSARRSEVIVCHPWSSVVAVMIQALAHRMNYVWVVEEDYSVVGIVTFAGILNVFRSAGGRQKAEGETVSSAKMRSFPVLCPIVS